MNITTRHYDGPALTREAAIRGASLSKESRQVDVVMSTGAIVRRRGWSEDFDEALPVERAQLARLNTIGPVLDNHRAWGSVADTLGSVVPGSVRVEGTQLIGRIQFANTERGNAVMNLVADGHLRAVSLGYEVDSFTETRAKDRKDGGTRSLLTPTSWEPYEVSVVQMPADAGATVRADEKPETRRYAVRSTEEIQTMTAPAQPVTEQPKALDATAITKRSFERLATFEALAASHKVDQAKVRSLVAEFDDDAKVGFEILKLATEAQRASEIVKPQPPPGDGKIEVVRAAEDKQTEVMGLALMHRALGNVDPGKLVRFAARAKAHGNEAPLPIALTDETGRRMRRARLVDLAETFLRSRGINTSAWSNSQIAEAALAYRSNGGMMTSSDFAGLLANTANKLLSVGYAEVTSPWRDIGLARRLDRPDFKTFTMYRRAGAPSLAKINEHGEIKRSGWADASSLTGQLSTAGVEVAFTRQMLVNDDLDAFSQQNLGLGDSAVRWEDDAVVTDLLVGNATLSDSVAFFHTDRGNISADTGAPDIAAITVVGHMFAAMTETIRDPANNNGTKTRKIPGQLRAYYAALTERIQIEQIIDRANRRAPDAPTNAAPEKYAGLVVYEDPRLQVETSAPDVHFALSNRTALVYGGLEGDPSPRLSMQVTTGTDGVIWQLVHDWYVAVEDPKAIIRIPKS